MKIKFLSILIFFMGIGLTTSIQAQEEEGGDFWTEEESGTKDGTKQEASSEKAKTKSNNNATARVKPTNNSCGNREELREEVRLLIRPFKYNLSKTTMITYKRYPQLLRVIIPIYNKQEHRLIFSTKGLPQDIGIKIYDKAKSEKKRKVLFSGNSDDPINTFELGEDFKGSYLFVEYSVPATENEDRSTTQRGCVVMMMGYLYLPKDEGEGTVDTDGSEKKSKK